MLPFFSQLLRVTLQFQEHILSTHTFMYLSQLFTIIFSFNPTFNPVFTTFITTIQSFTLHPHLIILFLSLLILSLQLTSRISFIRGIYLPVFYIFSTNISPTNILSVFFTMIALSIDICKNTFRLLTVRNLESQPYNEIKAALCVLNIVSVLVPKEKMFVLVAIIVGYIVLLGLRIKHQVSLKQLQMIEELWCVAAIISLSFKCVIGASFEVQLWVNISATLFTLLLYLIVRLILSKDNLRQIHQNQQQMKKNNRFLQTIQFIFSYLIDPYWDQQTIPKIELFLNNDQPLPKSVVSVRKKQEYLMKLYHLTMEHKEYYSSNYQYWCLVFQMEYMCRHNIPSMVTVLELIRKIIQQTYYLSYPFRWLEVDKLEQMLSISISRINEIEEKQFQHKHDIRVFQINDSFVDKVRQTTRLFASVWSILREKCSANKRIDELVESKDQVHQMYRELGGSRSRFSTRVYMDYLLYAERNLSEYQRVLDDFTISYFPEIDETVFVEGVSLVLGLEGEIVEVGNCDILGFHKEELHQNTLEILLPSCVKGSHHHWMSRHFDQIQNQGMLSRITRFNKNTYCVDRQDYLKQVQVKLSLCLIQNDVRMAGLIRVKNSKCFIYNKHTNIIVCSSEGLQPHPNYPGVVHSINYNPTFPSNQQLIPEPQQIRVIASIQNIHQNQEYILDKTLQVEGEQIWILVNPKPVHQFKHPSSSIISPNKSKQSVLVHSPKPSKARSSKTQAFLMKKQQLESQNYPLKQLVLKLTWISVLLCMFLVTLVLLCCNHSKILQERTKYSKQIETIEIATIKSNALIHFVYYLDFIVKENVTFQAIGSDQSTITHYQSEINYIRTLYNIIEEYPSYSVNEQFTQSTHLSNSLLLFKTVIVSMDWLVTDFEDGDIRNSVEEIVHMEENCEITAEILEYYQNLMLGEEDRFSEWRGRELIITICMMVVAMGFGVTLLFLDFRIMKESASLNGVLLTLDPAELTGYIADCFNFLKFTYTTSESLKIPSHASQYSNYSNSQHSKQWTQMSLLQNSSMINNGEEGQCNRRVETEVDQIMIPVEFQDSECQFSKAFLIALIVVVVAIQGVVIGAYFLSQSHQQPIKRLMESASALRRQHAVYNSIHLNLLGSIINSSQLPILKTKIDNYNTVVNKQLQNYQSREFEHQFFAHFRQIKNSLDFASMCDFEQCDKYQSFFNTSYSSSVLHALKQINQIYTHLSQPNVTLSISQIKDQHPLEQLVYASEYFTNLFQKILRQMMGAITKYMNYLSYTESVLYYIMIVEWVLMIGMGGWTTVKLVRSRGRGSKILGLFVSKNSIRAS